jgi:hypothetical protein
MTEDTCEYQEPDHGAQFWRLNRPWFRSILSQCQMSPRM